MREIRLSGSEGGGTELNRFSLPLSLRRARNVSPIGNVAVTQSPAQTRAHC